MTRAVLAKQGGDDFQARLFWLQAARLLDRKSPVARVIFEKGPKAFDDIVVEYDVNGKKDHEGIYVSTEYFQSKWHVKPGVFGYADLVDPNFIRASSLSFLQRVREAQLIHAPDGYGCRFKLITTHQILHSDPLNDLVRTRSGYLDLEKLFQGKTDDSRFGRVRELWARHLGIDYTDLHTVARVLDICIMPGALDDIRDRLDDKFAHVGLKRIPADETSFPYDDLIRKLHEQGRVEFDRGTFREMCRNERLLVPQVEYQEELTIGIRSFVHPIDNLEDRCDELLNLVPYFDGRYLRDEGDWQRRIVPEVRSFVAEKARSTDSLRLVLDAHVSLAFAVGTILNDKCGKRIEIEQRGNGRKFWSADDSAPDTSWPAFIFEENVFDDRQDHMAVAISLTHDVGRAAHEYAQTQLPQVGSILYCRFGDGPSALSVKCGRHARQLAEAVLRKLSERPWPKARKPVHFFIAGPNAFAFFLGQLQPAMGPVCVYEWDFEGQRDGTYSLGFAING